MKVETVMKASNGVERWMATNEERARKANCVNQAKVVV